MCSRQERWWDDSPTKPLSRLSILEKQRAIAGATNTVDSKLGAALLLRRPADTDPCYRQQVSRLEGEGRRLQTDLQRSKRQVARRMSLLPEPTILLQRPGTMCPLDAFKVRRQRKRNVWEGRGRPVLDSLHTPYSPLSHSEQSTIYQRMASLYARPLRRTRTLPDIANNRRLRPGPPPPPPPPPPPEPSTDNKHVMLTQMPCADYETLGERRVQFDPESKQVTEEISEPTRKNQVIVVVHVDPTQKTEWLSA